MVRKNKQASIINLPVPDELIEEILLVLPAQTLLRFRCIDKSRRRLIANPDFIREHQNRSTSDASRYFVLSSYYEVSLVQTSADNKCKPSTSVASPPQLDPSRPNGRLSALNVVGSENGLVCIREGIHEIHLWNPSLGQFRTLPYLEPSYGKKTYSAVVRFGFHRVSAGVDDFKVIKMSYLRNPGRRKENFADIDVYSLNKNSWRSIGGHCLPFEFETNPRYMVYRTDFATQVVVNGIIHWMALFETTKGKVVLT